MSDPTFPGYAACLRMMRDRDALTQEHGYHWLLPHVAEYVGELVAEFRSETRDRGLRCWLLELLGEAKDLRTLGLFREQLLSADESLRDWAIRGLRLLETAEARAALSSAGIPVTGDD
jgi:hypothetical protein